MLIGKTVNKIRVLNTNDRFVAYSVCLQVA